MKVRLILIIFLIFSCKKDNSKEYYSDEINTTEKINIQLPDIENWKELSSNKLVKERFEKESFEGTSLIGIYLPNKYSNKSDSLDTIDLDNYALLYTRDKEQKWKIKNSDLKRIFQIQLKKASIENIDINDIKNKKKIDSILSNKIDTPYFFKTFRTTENSFSAIKIIKPYENSEPVLYIYNLINIKNHLIYAGYYQNFENQDSLDELINNNNLIVTSIINSNTI